MIMKMRLPTCLLASIDHLLMPVPLCAPEGVFSPGLLSNTQSFSSEAGGEEV